MAQNTLTSTRSTAASLLIAVVLLTGCNVNKKLNKEKETFKEREQLKEERDLTERLEITSLSHRLDSGRVTDSMVLEIIPIGPFRYSLSDGFEGEAVRIQLRGNRIHEYMKILDSNMNRQEYLTFLLKKNEERERSLQRKSKDKAVQRSMTTPLILAIVLLGLVGLVFSFLRARR